MTGRIITGEYRPHLEAALLEEARPLVKADPPAPGLVVVPTNSLGLHLSRYLATELGGHADLRFMTLLDLARRLGEKSLAGKRASPLPESADLLLLRRIIDEYLDERADSYFAGVASTAGFLKALLAAVTDLKEGLLTPDDLEKAASASALRRTAGGKVEELVRLWRRYEERKSGAGFYDRSDLMAEAESSIDGDRWFSSLEKLVFYGFYDLNPIQRSFVRKCIQGKETAFLMPFVETPAFDYARPTLDWLDSVGFRRRGDGLPRAGGDGLPRAGGDGLPRAGGDMNFGLKAIRARLFAGGRQGASETGGAGGAALEDSTGGEVEGAGGVGAPGGLLILSAPGEERESREIVREMLKLAGLGGSERDANGGTGRGGAAPPAKAGEGAGAIGDLELSEVGVLLRNPSRYVQLLSRELDGLGIEPFVREGIPLSNTRSGRSLLLLTELVESDLSRRDVMDFLTFSDLDARGPASDGDGGRAPEASFNPALWDSLSAEAGVVSGLDQWREKLSNVSRDEVEGAAARRLLFIVERLGSGIESIRSSTGPGALVRALSDLFRGMVAPGAGREAALEALEQVSSLESCDTSVDLSFFLWLVRRRLESTQVRRGSLHGEGPVLSSLMSARGLPFKVVIVPGLTEGAFPAPAGQDPVLLDGERRAINEALEKLGLAGRLAPKSERLKEERLLFRLAAGAASELLILSFPRIDPAKGAERVPSGFVLDAASCLTGARCDLGSLDGLPFFARVPLARLFPDDGAFIDRAELDLMIADRAVAGDRPALEHLRSAGTFVASALGAEERRWDEFVMTPYDAVMESPAVLEKLTAAFAEDGAAVSPTSIEDYCRCPFLYLMRHIFRIRPVKDPEEVLTMPPLDRGQVAHAILEKTFEKIFADGRTLSPDWKRTLVSVASRALEALRRTSPGGLPLLRELEERTLVAELTASVAQDLEELGDFRPWGQELRYGSGADRFLLELDGGRSVAIEGKIDRVDLSTARAAARVIDYKTGKGSEFKENRLKGGTTIQLPLYVLGARRLLGDGVEVESAQYYFVSGERRGRRVRFTADAVEGRMAQILEIVGAAVRGVERGLFFAYPGDFCGYCDYRMACAPAQQVFERKQSDPRLQEFLRIKEID